MVLEKKITFTNGIHQSFTIKRPLPTLFKFQSFFYNKNKKRNKTLSGSFNLRSSKPIIKGSSSIKVLSTKNIKSLKFLVQFAISSFNSKIVALFCCSNGSFFYLIATTTHRLFKFYFKKLNFKRSRYRCGVDSSFLWNIKRMVNFCCFSFSYSLKRSYATSIGSSSKMFKIDKKKEIAVIILPSKQKKIISLLTLVYLGYVKHFTKKKKNFTKAGYLRLRGVKSNSRGVCMNPVDHPHGGNTKSLKLHRTPWGLPTKKK